MPDQPGPGGFEPEGLLDDVGGVAAGVVAGLGGLARQTDPEGLGRPAPLAASGAAFASSALAGAAGAVAGRTGSPTAR